MIASVAVAMLARHLHTPIPDVEEMFWDRFALYIDALNVVLRMEAPKRG
ncbi:hypothetical protein [Rhodopseudomonas parapalustris]